MKRLLVLVAVAFGAVALYAVTAPAGQQAVTPGQITAINKKIATLQKQVKTLNAVASCTAYKAIALTEYSGFQYQQAPGTIITTTAIATTDEGQTPQWYILTTSPSCAQAIGVGRAPARLVAHR